ncbi:MAG: cyclic nucleotide-binding domain-containing protein [Limnothrix sp. RL_2_0]|nr:cyclic nucleotide-binding domain-containing protein [Limnothrix sp. RL_2_0]
MTLTNINTIHHLQTAPVLGDCSVQDLSRLIPFISERFIKAEEILFESETPADTLYLIVEGNLKLMSGKRQVDLVTQAFLGEEAAIGYKEYTLTGVAVEDSTVLAIDKDALIKITSSNPNLEKGLYQSFVKHYLYRKPEIDQTNRDLRILGLSDNPKTKVIIGWITAIILPIIVALVAARPAFEISESIQQFLTVFSPALILWTFDLVAAFIPAVIIVFSLLVLDIAPSSLVLSGFSSSSFFLALSIFALGAVLSSSGLTYRLVLIILKAVPQSQFSYSVTLFLIGLLLTPVLPSANGRTQLVAPLLVDMVDALQLKPSGKGSTRLAFSAFSGTTFMSFLFLSSKPINFVLVGLLPTQVRDRFSLPYWTLAAGVAGLVAIADLSSYRVCSFVIQKKPPCQNKT